MKYLRISLAILLSLAMTSWIGINSISAHGSVIQGQSSALERGYRTGYSDGYSAGSRDIADQAAREYQNKDDYQRADRSYNQAWGPLEDYRDGYQQGFEAGYSSGYDRQPFNSSIPTGLTRRGTSDVQSSQTADTQTTPTQTSPDENVVNTSVSPNTTVNAPVFIPTGTTMLVELDSSLSSDASQRGDRFRARVLEPAEFQGATIDGRVTRVKRPGRVKGVAELQLAFEQLQMPDGRMSTLRAEVVEVIDTGNRDIGDVDPEGGVRGRSSTKDDVSKVGAATGIGAIIGAIAGGGAGAAIGAAIGGAAAAGGVLTSRGKDIRLDRGQRLRIRTSTEVRIQ